MLSYNDSVWIRAEEMNLIDQFFIFLLSLGSILNSPVKISLNKDGSELVLPWYKDGNEKSKPIG